MDKKMNEPATPPPAPEPERTAEEQAKWDSVYDDLRRSAEALLAEAATRQNPPTPTPPAPAAPAKNPPSSNGDITPAPQPRTREEAYAAWEADRQARIRAYDKYLNFPSANGTFEEESPLPNGVFQEGTPSSNGKLPPQPPSNGRPHKK
jgi:hypothetical protein